MSHLTSVTLCLIGCLFAGSALDISDVSLINPDPVVSSATLPSLLCVSSDWTGSGGSSSLSLGHDYPDVDAHVLSSEPDPSRHSAAKVTWISRNHTFGAFYCQDKNSNGSKIYTYKMLYEADFYPESLTITVNKGEDVKLSFTTKKYLQEDIVIYKNGNFEHSSPKEDITDIYHLPITNTKASHAGLYSIHYISRALFSSAITRLIVRSCGAGLWGVNCTNPCPPCTNGGVCHDGTGECICPPGFHGPTCQTVCGEGRFGPSCKERCEDGLCRSLVFCLRDPYGCSCASGWKGLNCSEACPSGYYGADCKQKCVCERGECNRFRGCVCPGMHGYRCETRDRRPVIASSLRDMEINSGASNTINCSASGQPAPLHGEITLVKPDRSRLDAVDTQTENDQTTSTFRLEEIPLSAAGRWLCQVKTKSFQEEKDFIVNVKVPPQAQNRPVLNHSGPHHLILQVDKDPFTGDGPVTSVKVVYRRAGASTWRSVEAGGSLVKLDHLSPMTDYTTAVQLSRRGPGGAGQPWPEATFSTQVLEPLTGVKLTPVNQTSLVLSWDAAPADDTWGYKVTCQQVGASETVRKFQLVSNSSSLHLSELKPRHKYQCSVTTTSSGTDRPSPTASAWTLSDQRPPPPANISTYDISDSSAIITWCVPEGHSVSRAIIRYQQTEQEDYSQQVELGVQPDQTSMSFQLRGLRADSTYQLQLWTLNNVGESAERPEVTLQTLTSQESKQLLGLTAHGNMLFYAILGSAGMTCITILLAFCIVLQLKKATFQRRMVQAFHNIVREEPVVQFSSVPLNMPKKVHNSSQSVAYPALDWSDIKFQDVIGEGNFGQVLKARIKKDGLRMDAAIKRMKEYASKDDHRDFAGELEVLCKLGHHPNIINLLGACEHRGYLYLAIEYAPHGNLLDFLRKSRVLETDPAFAIANSTASTLSSQQLLHFAADVAGGMDYLSQKQFIHRDLAARNILVGENFMAKIADFGLSRGQEVYVKKTMGRLPVRWMAIESLNYSVYTSNSDVWSYGVLLWEVVSLGGTPYCGLTCAELYEKLPLGFRLEKPLNCDDEVYELMKQCWKEKPYERPSFAQILMSLGRMLEERKTYVNTTLYEKFTYAGIDCSAEEAG
ncbi:tyrosine-protein kinase receptor Tie-2 [Pimephales promelas]|uniref:tyrosine-protein kinase receptor Tie-2 n=1 Tax=Pimephales promelas TaxID=90988 RepID=UPI0019556885|nr:tyrosine-protein kinase receptor Tie-2 [Pimephales promelas]